ncbi:MAG: GGDEF domain-containing protein [Acidobacteria bacterium]|nr:GGDEF domain-containing protein [Acidobacteriota bacterium]
MALASAVMAGKNQPLVKGSDKSGSGRPGGKVPMETLNFPWLSHRKHLFLFLSSLALIVGIGWLDHVTGPEIGLSLLYLVPVCLAGWWLGQSSAALLAVFASLFWLWSDLAALGVGHLEISLWNWATRVLIYLALGILLALLRADRRRLQELLERQKTLALTDPLTGLANSRAFLSAFQLEHARARRDGHPLCLVYFDLDNFKRVNDLYGHEAGDDLLVALSGRIRSAFRATDPVARLGGDEFAALLWECDPACAEAITRRVLDQVRACAEAYPRAGVGVSAGIAFCERVPEDLQSILRCADAAMYQGKAEGKGKIVLRACDGAGCEAATPGPTPSGEG